MKARSHQGVLRALIVSVAEPAPTKIRDSAAPAAARPSTEGGS
ncbi:hypothetical protein [Streptomyces sp. S.PB5]|nr:hypothetical protein [Streptomyces sp. S.PB5]MDN3027852.1 hypothetical protein [Streptomyces sp. S.PB5]